MRSVFEGGVVPGHERGDLEQVRIDRALERLNPDPVNHPSHYNAGKIEVIEAIEDWGLTYHRGNAVKYLARAGKKDKSKELQDLQKAQWYIQREIERLQAASEGREPVRPNDMGVKR